MSLPPLQLRPVSTSHFYISGDVTIQDGAAIAPGVLIQADPDSRIVIKTGACIGIGTILHACQGMVEVGEGANIGAEVLLIGQVTIGAHACIGSATTILNSAIEGGRVVPPGSLIGEANSQTNHLHATDTVIYPTIEAEVEPTDPSVVASTPDSTPQSEKASGVSVYGQLYVNQMLVKMFPQRQHSATAPAEPSQPSDASLTIDPWDEQ